MTGKSVASARAPRRAGRPPLSQSTDEKLAASAPRQAFPQGRCLHRPFKCQSACRVTLKKALAAGTSSNLQR